MNKNEKKLTIDIFEMNCSLFEIKINNYLNNMSFILKYVNSGLAKGFLNPYRGMLKRWPNQAKIVFITPPNVFTDEISQRYFHSIIYLEWP